MGKMVNTAFASQFTWGSKFSRANAVFTIFTLDLIVVCTFLHHICTE